MADKMKCEVCEAEIDVTDGYEAYDLVVTESGVSPGTPDGPAVHWFEGMISCPECNWANWVSDSS